MPNSIEITARLADPRGLSEAEAQKLIAEGKPIYWADGSIHSPEIGAPEMLMELAYRLAVEDTPFIQKIRKDSIVLITPIVETRPFARFSVRISSGLERSDVCDMNV